MEQTFRRQSIMPCLSFLASALLAFPPSAQARQPEYAVELKRLEAKIPAQSWYPEGYYDARIAAEAELAETMTPKKYLTLDWEDGLGRRYDILGCGGYAIVPKDVDKATMRYGDVALEISRMRSELERIGYPAAVYTKPLSIYERHLVARAATRSDADVRIAVGLEADGASEALPDGNNSLSSDDLSESGQTPEFEFGAELEANRKILSPTLPIVVAEGECGDAPPAPVIVRTLPPGGTVSLISAFAFKVCARKTSDPWDRFSCRWNEVETGVPIDIRGRNAYQVKWPDGRERRGIRNFPLNFDDDTPTTARFRKTGS